MQREVHRLARRQRVPADAAPVGEVERDRGGQHQPLGAAPCGDAAVDLGQQRHDQPVLGPRRVVDLDLDRARGAGHPAYQQVRDVGAEPVAAVVLAHRQQVGHHEGPGRRW